MRHLLITAASFVIVMALWPVTSRGQSAYPVKNIRVIVPSPTGGPSDIVATQTGKIS